MQTLYRNRAAVPTTKTTNRKRRQTQAVLGTLTVVIAGILLVAAGLVIAGG